MKRIVVFALVLNAALLGVIAHQLVAIAGGGAVATQNGDTNGDGSRDIGDAIYLLHWFFYGGEEPAEIICPIDQGVRVVELEGQLAEANEIIEDLRTQLEGRGNPAICGLIGIGADLWGERHDRLDLRTCNLIEADLAGANLAWAILEGVDMRGSSLVGATLEFTNLRFANLEGANLQGAAANETDLRGANLVRVNLSNARMIGSRLFRANLQGATLRNVHFSGNMMEANLQSADLQGARLRGVSLQRANLTGASLLGADFQNADLRGAIGVNLDGSIGVPAFMPDD